MKRAPLGDPATLARLTIRALERGKKRLVYPRGVTVAYEFPFIARGYAARMAARYMQRMGAEEEALLSSVVRGGSTGDPMAQAARETWERRGRRAAR